jgi:hypothetical protein
MTGVTAMVHLVDADPMVMKRCLLACMYWQAPRDEQFHKCNAVQCDTSSKHPSPRVARAQTRNFKATERALYICKMHARVPLSSMIASA